MLRESHIALIASLVILASACAKQNSAGPSGGPKDETPPVVVSADPPDKTVNFSRKEFQVTFDEYFALNSVDQKLMISPPFDKKPEVKIKGKTLLVSFEEELRDSITYTFYFMDAIRDLNENNPVENFQYVFSTGPTLDSLSVTGTVYDANTLDPGEEIFVMLYSNLSDTAPVTSLPEYITRAGTDGKFRIDNIAGGEYAIYALKDLNNNKYFDLPEERFAFIDSTITLNGQNNYIPGMPDTLKTAADSAAYLSIPGNEYRLFLFTPESRQQYITSTTREPAYKLVYTFRQPVDSGQFRIEFADTVKVNYLLESSANRDTMVVWLLDSVYYARQRVSVITNYPATDSTGAIAIIRDTIDFRYSAPRVQRGRSTKEPTGLKVNHTAGGRSGFRPSNSIKFSFSTPILNPDTSHVKLYLLADTSLLPLKYKIYTDSLSNKKARLEHAFIQDSTYQVILNRGAFIDIFRNQNDSAAVKFKVRNAESYGTLKVRLSGYKGNIILQLLGSDKKIVREDYVKLNELTEVYYPLLEKGEYTLKAVFDINGDRKWTTGDFGTNRQPEPVTFFPAIIDIKVQWDLVQDWEINAINDKSDMLRENSSVTGRK